MTSSSCCQILHLWSAETHQPATCLSTGFVHLLLYQYRTPRNAFKFHTAAFIVCSNVSFRSSFSHIFCRSADGKLITGYKVCLIPMNEVYTERLVLLEQEWVGELIASLSEHFNQFSSVTQSCPTLCDPMNCSTPGLPVHHQLPEFTQTYVHRVGNAIQPSHPLSSPSPPTLNPSQRQSLFQWVNSSHEVAKVLEFQL